MTSVSFPFLVGPPDPSTKQITLVDAEFRFNTKAARLLERASGGSLSFVLARRQSAELAVLLVCYGLLWNDDSMTEDKACDLIDEFITAGGDTTALVVALYKALDESGVYGKPETKGTKRPTKKVAA